METAFPCVSRACAKVVTECRSLKLDLEIYLFRSLFQNIISYSQWNQIMSPRNYVKMPIRAVRYAFYLFSLKGKKKKITTVEKYGSNKTKL